MNEFDKLRSWLWAAAGGAVLAAIAFIFADPADPETPFILVIGFLLALAATGVGLWAFLRLNALKCPKCEQQFAPVIATLDRLLPDEALSDHCAHCGMAYERRRWDRQPAQLA